MSMCIYIYINTVLYTYMLAATVSFNAVVVNPNCVQRRVIIIYYFITPLAFFCDDIFLHYIIIMYR